MIRILINTFLLLACGMSMNLHGQTELPPCNGSDSTTWTNCRATKSIEGGGTYVGGFVNGKESGHATVTLSNGTLFVGEFKDGTMHGYGTVTYPDGNKYVGEYRNGRYNGQGIFTLPNGKKYDGEFKDGKMSGSGILFMPDGSEYVGDFQNNDMNGRGTFKFKSGNIYVGEFKNGTITGKGIFTFANGDPPQEGIWIESKFIRAEKVISQPINLSKPENKNNQTSSLMDGAKIKCADLGFKVGTETFGNCVLKLLK
jgi:hypothetical protein